MIIVASGATRFVFSVFLTGVMAGMLSSCASAPHAANGLEARVEQYWMRRKAKDLIGAYPFYCEAYRSRVSQNQYAQLTRLNRFDLTDLKVGPVVAQGDRAQVTISYKFKAPMVTDQSLDGQTTDAWKRDTNGQWCKEDEPVVLPFPPGVRGDFTRQAPQ